MSVATALERLGTIELPPHRAAGGFDHAAVHGARGRLYVAHTANDAIDVIDTSNDRYLGSIDGLTVVAGALVSEEPGIVFTSNRGEDTVGWFDARQDAPADIGRVAVGRRPNGLAFDASRRLLLAANVGDPKLPGAAGVSLVSLDERAEIARIATAGRTRWTVFDPVREVFFVNVADPPTIALVDPRTPNRIVETYAVPATGPHGLDLDVPRRRLYCACDAARMIGLDADRGTVLGDAPLSGGPDVIFLNARRNRIFVAIGEPGVIDVLDTSSLERIETITTEPGAHSIGFDSATEKVYAFLPQTHRAAVFRDRGP